MPSILRVENQRKYAAFMAVFLGSLIALFFDNLTAVVFQQIIVPAFGLFVAGNVGEHWSKKND